ncbi:MAG TPA: hemerythrin domain-containing protein [Ignavibacteriales bacterium]|nr:hemerythrin domain-containing protein [Ignavibacteriales bacterium]
MPRSKSLVPLSHDHHHALKLAQMLRKDSPPLESIPESPVEKARRAAQFYESDLVVHFNAEENVLYPFVKRRDAHLDRLFNEILEEHRQIKKQVEALLEEGGNPIEEKLDTLGRLIDSHVRKEERELFPRIQEVFSEDELNKLSGKLRAVR